MQAGSKGRKEIPPQTRTSLSVLRYMSQEEGAVQAAGAKVCKNTDGWNRRDAMPASEREEGRDFQRDASQPAAEEER